MCDPLTIAAAAVTAGGQITAGMAAHNQAKYAAGIANQNAKLTNEQGKDAILNTNIEAQRRYREGAQLQGQQQAAMAANGVDLSFGSALQTQEDTKMITGEDVGQIYKAGHEASRGFDIKAFNYRSDAEAKKSQASAATLATVFGVASTALGAASQVSKLHRPGG